MRGVFDDRRSGAGKAPAGVWTLSSTLGSGTLLAIFFGFVLICGLCFGLGYALGHRSTQTATSAPGAAGFASGPLSACDRCQYPQAFSWLHRRPFRTRRRPNTVSDRSTPRRTNPSQTAQFGSHRDGCKPLPLGNVVATQVLRCHRRGTIVRLLVRCKTRH